MIDALLEKLAQRDRRSLSRLLTLAGRGEDRAEIDARLASLPQGKGRVIAFTGSAGVGKSTLVGKLIETARADGKSVAVLACDPQSPLTGGALLGDRFRMGPAADDGVFIRSLATPGGNEAIAPRLPTMLAILQAFGFDLIFLETVGAGQTDTAVSRLADIVVLLLQPESGDDLQWEKAGVLEVADVIVVHKADLPGAERTLGQLKGMLELSSAQGIDVLGVSSQTKEGIEDLYRTLWSKDLKPHSPNLTSLAREEFEQRLSEVRGSADFERLEEEWISGKVNEAKTRADVWRLLS